MSRRRAEIGLGRAGDRVAVISPHPDDAVLSLGAAIARAVRSGINVIVLTVLAGRPDSSRPAGWWDSRAGFASEGEAARARREEDRRACARLGARPVWLPYPDGQYEPSGADGEIAGALAAAGDGVDAVLIPGFPLAHGDHARVHRLALEAFRSRARVGLYVEQPYASIRVIARGSPLACAGSLVRLLATPAGRAERRPPAPETVDGPLAWRYPAASLQDRLAKWNAVQMYRSQLRPYRTPVAPRIFLYEWWTGGEALAWY